MARRVALLGIVVAALISCGSGSPRPDGDSPSAGGVSPSNHGQSAPTGDPPMTVQSTKMRDNTVRLQVSSADLSNLVRVRGNTIVALADDGAYFGEVYPAISYDDGGDWRIDGPRFARAGPCGGCTTNHLAVSADGTIMAWGPTGNSVYTTTDLGRRWYAASFGGVEHATVSGSRLIVATFGARSGSVRTPHQRYVSRDDGRSWDQIATTP
jgi:hypothetical protein